MNLLRRPLDKQLKEIVVTFKHSVPCLCPPGEKRHFKNKLIIRLEPKEEIKVIFSAKKPDFDFTIHEQQLSFSLREKKRKTQYVKEYEKLFLDCIRGDQTLFVSNEEVKSMWRFIDPILKSWKKEVTPLKIYKPGTNEPEIESEFIVESKLPKTNLKKEIGIIGLGKMGAGIAKHLIEEDWRVVGYNRTGKTTKELEKEGLDGAFSLAELIQKLTQPRLIWLMVPAGRAVDEILFGKNGLAVYLDKEDIVVDGGNSFYKDSVRRDKRLVKQGIEFVDVGVSGGPAGARNGACFMVGGERKLYEQLLPLYLALSVSGGVEFFAGTGAGHFVKMIHNGIEYGMMQAIAEGFTILKQTKYRLKLNDIARVYNHGSVIESRLIGWLEDAFEIYGEELERISGTVRHRGEGEWTVKTAKQIGVKAKIIEEALKFRIESEKKQNYTGRILSALRKQFGGHSVSIKDGY